MAPANWLSGAGRLARLSLPGRVMLVLFLFVVMVILGYYIILWQRNDSTTFWAQLSAPILIPLLVVSIALPVTAFYATKFWLETPPSEFPDIDEAWRLGIAGLSRAGIDIGEIPLYFTLGVTDAKTADQVMQAANWDLKVDGLPDGSHPLRWYASKKAVMLFLLDVGSTSKIHTSEVGSEPEAPADLRGTLVGAPAAAPPPASNRGLRGTIVAGAGAPVAPSGGGGDSGPQFSLKGTMIAGSPAAGALGGSSAPSPQLAKQELIEQSQRLARVCELATGSRLPLCPLNGILGIVDWNLLLASRNAQLAAALRADYDAVIDGAKMYAPMVILINGLDIDAGFVELVRRVGEERAKNNRFGHGFNHLVPPEHNQMVALAAHAAGAFEDWIYDLFKHPDCLDRTNNEKLFSLLCRTRNELNPRLTEMLAGLSSEGTRERRIMLAGCYFGATGKNQAKQAFVRSVIEKLVQLEDDIEWSESALVAENRLQSILRFVIFLNALLVVFILCVVGYKFFFTGG